MLDGILVLIGLQVLLLLPFGFDWLDKRMDVEVCVDSVSSQGVPFYFYGRFIRFVEI